MIISFLHTWLQSYSIVAVHTGSACGGGGLYFYMHVFHKFLESSFILCFFGGGNLQHGKTCDASLEQKRRVGRLAHQVYRNEKAPRAT